MTEDGLSQHGIAEHGFVRVAAAAPAVRIADCRHNAQRALGLMKRAQAEGAAVLVMPELSLTGYTCGDLFHQPALQSAAVAALGELAQESVKSFAGLVIMGLPLSVGDKLYNCA